MVSVYNVTDSWIIVFELDNVLNKEQQPHWRILDNEISLDRRHQEAFGPTDFSNSSTRVLTALCVAIALSCFIWPTQLTTLAIVFIRYVLSHSCRHVDIYNSLRIARSIDSDTRPVAKPASA